MGRSNNLTAGVFTNIVGDDKQIPNYTHFLSIQDILNKPTDQLAQLLETYRSNVTKNKNVLETLGKLEEVIMQMRSKENLQPKDIKLAIVREYIYARVPFFRKDIETKDLRVIVGTTKEWKTDNVEKLLRNKKFIAAAQNKLLLGMTEIINASSEELKNVWLKKLNN